MTNLNMFLFFKVSILKFLNLNDDISIFNISNIIEILNSRNLNLDNVINSIIFHMNNKDKKVLKV